MATGLLFGGGLVGQTNASTIEEMVVTTQQTITNQQENDTTIPNKVIKGFVKNKEYQDRLIGANIMIAGTSIHTTTDIDGFF